MATLDTIRPYVDQLFDDSDVQDQLTRAARNLRAAKGRAGKAKNKKKAATDARLRRQLVTAGSSLLAVAQALEQAPQKQKRHRRGRRVLLLGVVAAGGVLAANADARGWVLQQFGGGGQETT